MAEFQSSKFCYCIFGSLYKVYENGEKPKDSEEELPIKGLPHSMTYEIPPDFYSRFGETQIKVNQAFWKYCKPVFEELHPEICKTTNSFLQFCARVCEELSPNLPPPFMILGFCAIVSQLNLYCFQKGCFRYAEYAPRCLDTIINKSEYVKIFILQEKEKFRGYVRLRNYVRKMAREQSEEAMAKKMGRHFIKPECRRIKALKKDFQKPKFQDDPKIQGGVSEDSDISSDERNIPEDTPVTISAVVPSSSSSDVCSICKEENCVKYLEEFVNVFKDKYES